MYIPPVPFCIYYVIELHTSCECRASKTHYLNGNHNALDSQCNDKERDADVIKPITLSTPLRTALHQKRGTEGGGHDTSCDQPEDN